MNNSANLCGDIITIGRKVKARIIHTIPIPARIANVVNRSFVFDKSSIEDFAELIFALAQFIRPADSSSFWAVLVSAVLAESEPNNDLTPENIPDGADGADCFAVWDSSKSAGGV